MMRTLLPCLVGLALCLGCTSPRIAAIAGPEPGRHRVTIAEVALSDSDFTNSALGGPKDVEFRVLKDGAEVFKTRVPGFRGLKVLPTPFELDYDVSSRYEFKIDEVVLVSDGRAWSWSSSQPGNWIFEGRRNFGAGSSITFLDEKVR